MVIVTNTRNLTPSLTRLVCPPTCSYSRNFQELLHLPISKALAAVAKNQAKTQCSYVEKGSPRNSISLNETNPRPRVLLISMKQMEMDGSPWAFQHLHHTRLLPLPTMHPPRTTPFARSTQCAHSHFHGSLGHAYVTKLNHPPPPTHHRAHHNAARRC